MKKAFLLTTLAVALAGCAGDWAFRKGERLIAEGKTTEGLKELERAVMEDPGNIQYRTALIQSRETHLNKWFVEGDEAFRAGRYDEAEAAYREVQKLHAESPRAQSALASIDRVRRNQLLNSEAQAAFAKGDYESARSKARIVLAQETDNLEARNLLKQIDDKTGKLKGTEFPKLAATYRRPVTMEFRDASIKTLFDALSRQSGLNFVFDKDVRTDIKLTIFARDTAIADALEMLLSTGQLAKKVLNENTLLIYPALPAKHKDYQDLVVKGFFLANTDAKLAVNLVRSMAKTKDIYIDEKLNLLVVRDTPEAVRLVEKLIHLADRPEPEVMLEVEILEIKRTRLQELGVQYPTQFGVPNITKTPLLAPNAQGIQVPTGETVDTLSTLPLNIDKLRDLVWGDVTVSPSPTINVGKITGDVNILANPRIRVKNKEKAKVHIGDKVPVITSNVTSTGVTSESVSYLDVGLKVDVEPQVRLDGDVEIRVSLEVSNIVQQIKSATGTLTYQLGSRNASTILRLKDGETQVLAGLISDEDRSGASKIPGLGDLPLLGRLFSNQRDELSKTEIVLRITPRIIRNIARPELMEGEFFAGTESAASDQPLQLRPARGMLPQPVPSQPSARRLPQPGPQPEQQEPAQDSSPAETGQPAAEPSPAGSVPAP